jgi:DNA-binding XRE family transcriptional regulator
MRKLTATPFPDHSTVANPAELGTLVRAVRTAAGMTMEEAALTVQVAKQTLQDLEKGTGTVSLALVFKVLTGLGIRLRWQTPEGTHPANTWNHDALDAT